MSKYTIPFWYIAAFGKTVIFNASIIPAKAKLVRKNAAQHLKNDFNDFNPKEIKTIIIKKIIFIIMLNHAGMFSIKIISENIPPVTDAIRNRHALN